MMEQNLFFAPLRFLAFPWRKKLRIILGCVLFSWIMLSAPTGWIYDLGAGTGTEQGQMPDPSVSMVYTQADVEEFFLQNTPATAEKDGLIRCPLLRLRDPEYAGRHTRSKKSTIVISEYISVAYPAGLVRKLLLQFLAGGCYNSYFLAPLEDGSYVCVYFDDYLLLHPGGQMPVGYVRYATTEEKRMLRQMEEHYEVEPAYVLDMYRHGKVNWTVDLIIRAAVGILLLAAGSAIGRGD